MFYDRIQSIQVTCNTTGNATWTAADTQYSLPPTGLSNKWVKYTLLDSGQSKWETGRAQLSESAGTYTLTRGGSQVVSASTNSGSAESFTNSTVHAIFIAPDAEFYNNAEILLEAQTASASASIDFDLPAGFSEYRIQVRDIVPATDGEELFVTASTDSGSTYLNTSGDYYYRYNYHYADTTEGEGSSKTTTTGLSFGTHGSDSTESGSASITLHGCASTALYKKAEYKSDGWSTAGELFRLWGIGAFRTTSAVDNVKFAFANGNISSGTFKLYGIVE